MGTSFPTLDESPGFWLYRAHTQGVNLFRKMLQAAGYDLTPEQCGVLVRLKEFEGMNQSQLGKRLLKDRHNITRILNLLAARGCVERRPDEGDKRVYRIFLTENGRVLSDKLVPLLTSYQDRLLTGFSHKELLLVRKALGRIIKNIEGSE